MYPLPAHTVNLVLRYISPLTDSLPQHLISTPLRQRHHLFQIPSSSPVEYLCWPSPDNAKIADLLERLPLLFDQASYPTCYTSDPESIFAHVQMSPDTEGLRMLFHWDDIHGWKYHDLRLMPFPSSSFSTPQQSLISNSACGARPPQLSSLGLVAEADHISDDSCWGAHGSAGHDLTSPFPLRDGSKSDVAEGEDAYWAQYTSVQGSADSTLPSPLRINRNLRPANSCESAFPYSSQSDPIIDLPVDRIHHHPLASRLGPPSPNMLASLLSTVSPRKDVCSFVIDDSYSSQASAYSTDPSPEQTLADSELATPPLPNEYPDPVVSPDVAEANGVLFPKCPPRTLDEAEDKALTDGIKGLYYLWKAGRKEGLGEKDKTVFLRIVQAAVAHE